MAQDSGCGPEGCARTSEEHPWLRLRRSDSVHEVERTSSGHNGLHSLRDDKKTAACRGYEINPLTDFQVVPALVRCPGDVSPVTPSSIYMQICTVLQANVNRMETWAVRLR
jgi:hypothetical protein